MKLEQRSLKNYNCLNFSLITRFMSVLFFLLLLNFFLFLMQIVYSVIL